MKTSDYIVQRLVDFGISTVFGVTGGASIHLLHSLDKNPNIRFIPVHHEQAAAMAADGLARNGKLKQFQVSCAIATSGPGATNLITGIAGAFYDSVPIIFITGQVASFRIKKIPELRQFGFQETSIVEMVKSITKFAHQVKSLSEIESVLSDAYSIALSGRQGPVLIDIPDDFQRSSIPSTVMSFGKPLPVNTKNISGLEELKINLLPLINESKRPVFVIGSGARSSKQLDDLIYILGKNQIPILTTWGGKELVSSKSENLFGTFGTHGTRYGNFIVQNSDLVISVGARLSTRETGSPMSWFARDAKLCVVDIDEYEIEKFLQQGKEPVLKINTDVTSFIDNFVNLDFSRNLKNTNWLNWFDQCVSWKKSFPLKNEYSAKKVDYVNPYSFFQKLNDEFDRNERIVVDTGCAIAWSCQILDINSPQRLFHDFANTAMGWALPAGLGMAHNTDDQSPISIIVGDGSAMMNLQELVNLSGLKTKIRIYLLNNLGYAMVRQTEDQWLTSKRSGTSLTSGLKFPIFSQLTEASRIEYQLIRNDDDLVKLTSKGTTSENNPLLFEVMIDPEAKVIPQCLYGYPLEDMEPLLPREVFRKNMIIKSISPDGSNND